MATLLLVEDDAMNREMIARHLMLEGFQVLTALDGAQAIAMIAANAPDLILMDMGLPVLSGWQATQQLKADPVTRAIPIIALTAYAMAEDRERALLAGCDDYESTPVNFSRLRLKIKTLLDASAKTDQV
jgi:two-component system cell cycle response regulator DivK